MLVSLMLPNVRLSLAWLGLLPHNLRVITPDWEACVVVGHDGATKLRLVGVMLGNVVAMIRSYRGFDGPVTSGIKAISDF